MTLPLVDTFDGFLLGHQYLIHDRDPLFDGSFVSLLRSAGVERVADAAARGTRVNCCKFV